MVGIAEICFPALEMNCKVKSTRKITTSNEIFSCSWKRSSGVRESVLTKATKIYRNKCGTDTCVSCFYLIYWMEYVWKSFKYESVYKWATQIPIIQFTDNIQNGDGCSVNYSPLWGCAGDRVEIVIKVHCGTVLGSEFQHGGKFVPRIIPTMHIRLI